MQHDLSVMFEMKIKKRNKETHDFTLLQKITSIAALGCFLLNFENSQFVLIHNLCKQPFFLNQKKHISILFIKNA